MATHTSPAAWWEQDEATLMTVVDILNDVAKAQERAFRGASKTSKTDGKRKGGGDDGGT